MSEQFKNMNMEEKFSIFKALLEEAVPVIEIYAEWKNALSVKCKEKSAKNEKLAQMLQDYLSFEAKQVFDLVKRIKEATK